MNEANYLQKPSFEEVLYKLNNEIWTTYQRSATSDFSNFRDLYEVARDFIKIGDDRSINFERLLQTLIDTAKFLFGRDKVSPGNINLLQNLFTSSAAFIEERKLKMSKEDCQKLDGLINTLNEDMNAIVKKFRP
jgi:hypothetical protein